MIVPPVAVLLLLIVIPAFDAVRFSLGLVPEGNSSYTLGLDLVRSQRPTLKVFENLFANDAFRHNLSLTILVASVSTLILALMGYALALYGRFSTSRLAKIAQTLYLLPMFIPGIIAAYAISTFYSDHGLFQALLAKVGLPYHSPIRTPWGIVLGQVWTGLPFAVMMLSSGVDAVSDEQIEAARDQGASFWTILTRIVLPLNTVPLLIVVTFSLIGIFGAYTLPFLLGPTAPQMLGVSIQLNFGAFRQPQTAVALAVFSFVVCSLIGWIYVMATLRQNRGQS